MASWLDDLLNAQGGSDLVQGGPDPAPAPPPERDNWRAVLGDVAPMAIGLFQKDPRAREAIMRGYTRSMDRISREEQRRRDEKQQRVYREGVLSNQRADNERLRRDQELRAKRDAIDRLTAFTEDARTRGQQIAEGTDDPLAAQNQLAADLVTTSRLYDVPAAASRGLLPNMAGRIAERNRRRARELYEQAAKRFAPRDSRGNITDPAWEQSVTLQTGELFGNVTPARLREMFETPAVLTATGDPAVPSVVGSAPESDPGSFDAHFADVLAAEEERRGRKLTRTERSRLRLEARNQYFPTRQAAPRQPSARDVESAREQAYQAVLSGTGESAARTALQRVGLDADTEIGRATRRVDADVRALEGRMPVDRNMGEDRADPATYEARLKRAREELRRTVGGHGRSVTPGTPQAGTGTITRAEIRAVASRLGVTEAEAERQARDRGLTVVP